MKKEPLSKPTSTFFNKYENEHIFFKEQAVQANSVPDKDLEASFMDQNDSAENLKIIKFIYHGLPDDS